MHQKIYGYEEVSSNILKVCWYLTKSSTNWHWDYTLSHHPFTVWTVTQFTHLYIYAVGNLNVYVCDKNKLLFSIMPVISLYEY